MAAYPELVRHAGNRTLTQALELSVLASWRGYPLHVHVEGLRGTGKTTMIRAAAGLLGDIPRITGCPYNCDPAHPHCPQHRGLSEPEVAALGSERVAAPFLEISASAKLGTVVGSIDLARLAGSGQIEAALLPGTLARAHRGVVFVDEINRLADVAPELADALLDVMGTKPGRLQIEETGLPPVAMRCQVTVWAASNPDEEPGPLADVRRQLADRFDFAVAMQRPTDPRDVLAILTDDVLGAGAGNEVPGQFAALEALREMEVPVVPEPMRLLLAQLYCDFQLESLRAAQAWQAGATLMALRQGRRQVDLADVREVAELVLRHRLETEQFPHVLERLLEPSEPARLPHGPEDTPDWTPPRCGGEGAPMAGAAVPTSEHRDLEVPTASAGLPRGGTGSWRQRLFGPRGKGAKSGGGHNGGLPDALADPTNLPPAVPRGAAVPLADLPPEELWSSSRSAAESDHGG